MTYSTAFNIAFENVVLAEGGYSADPRDRGNWTSGVIGKGELKGTKYGISAMSYPKVDIKNLTVAKAQDIYYKDFWQALSLDSFEPELSYQLFDAAVQHGRGTALKLLIKSLGLNPMSNIASLSTDIIDRVVKSNQHKLVLKFIANRIKFYTQIKTFNTYGKGWMNRIANTLLHSSEM